MTAIEIITKKRDGKSLSDTEISWLIDTYTADSLPDYQLSAFLMAVYFQGMTSRETAALTRCMRDSGITLDLSAIAGAKIDKHSTGGVGDKVSLILAPLVAACGIINPMISGRGLGHSGGTLDKLEAIPGFTTQLSLQRFQATLKKHGTCLIGQTPEICPADKRLYALRDATATVASIPLICGSILSKKLAEDLDGLVLDVKCGNGAIFADPAKSRQLAEALVQTAAEFGLPTIAVLTAMDQPLGNTIGNWLETREAIEALHGDCPQDLREVTLELAAHMLEMAGISESKEAGLALAEKQWRNGEALRIFRDLVIDQEGDVAVIDDPSCMPVPRYRETINAEDHGCIAGLHARTLGELSMKLGAGRAKKEDEIDPLAGILLHKKVGDKVGKGDPVLTLLAQAKAISPAHLSVANSAITLTHAPAAQPELILGVVR